MTENYRRRSVLLVEDNPDDAALLTLQLEEAGAGGDLTVRHVQSLDAALEVLWASHVDAVLLDLALPDSFGLGTLELLRGAHPTVPVVVLTGLADEGAAAQALTLGAHRYVVKSTEPSALIEALGEAVTARRIQTHDAPGPSAAFLATHDPVTQLPNRYLFEDRLAQAVVRARRYRDQVGLLMLRVWSMPWLGIERESDAETAVMFELGRRLKVGTRRSDTVARIDGDTFALVLERPSNRPAVQRHLAGLLASLERPLLWRGSRISVRVQAGLAFCPDDAGDLESLLAAASGDSSVLQ